MLLFINKLVTLATANNQGTHTPAVPLVQQPPDLVVPSAEASPMAAVPDLQTCSKVFKTGIVHLNSLLYHNCPTKLAVLGYTPGVAILGAPSRLMDYGRSIIVQHNVRTLSFYTVGKFGGSSINWSVERWNSCTKKEEHCQPGPTN